MPGNDIHEEPYWLIYEECGSMSIREYDLLYEQLEADIDRLALFDAVRQVRWLVMEYGDSDERDALQVIMKELLNNEDRHGS